MIIYAKLILLFLDNNTACIHQIIVKQYSLNPCCTGILRFFTVACRKLGLPNLLLIMMLLAQLLLIILGTLIDGI
jgi:hypothetical protein